LEMESEAHKL